MDRKLSEYPEKYDWVKVRSNKKHSLGRRKWNGNTNMLIGEDEIVILPRGVEGENDSELSGMKFYFKNGFYEIVDHEPFDNDLENNNSNSDDEQVQCTECDRSFGTEKGMKQHRRQKHEDYKKEENEG